MERTTGILLLCLALTPAGSAAGSPPKIVSSDETACVAAMRLAVTDAVPAGRGRDCWRVGPVTLGMSEADVERRLGTPVAVNDALSSAPNSSHRYRATLYAFPARGAGLVVAGQADLRLAELRYERGRLAAIDNAPGARIDGYECASRARRRRASETISVSALAGPMLRSPAWASESR